MANPQIAYASQQSVNNSVNTYNPPIFDASSEETLQNYAEYMFNRYGGSWKNKDSYTRWMDFLEQEKTRIAQLQESYNNNYNNEANTTQRLIDAGYNPNFQSGQAGQASTSLADASMKYNPEVSTTQRQQGINLVNALSSIGGNLLGSIMPILQGIAQIDKTKAETQLIKSSNPMRLDYLEKQNTSLGLLNDLYRDLNPRKVENQTLKNLGIDISNRLSESQLDFYNKTFSDRLKYIKENGLSSYLENTKGIFDLFGSEVNQVKKNYEDGVYSTPSEGSSTLLDRDFKGLRNQVEEYTAHKIQQLTRNLKLQEDTIALTNIGKSLSNDEKEAFLGFYKNSMLPAMSSRNNYDISFYNEMLDKLPDTIKNKFTKESLQIITDAYKAQYQRGVNQNGKKLTDYFGAGGMSVLSPYDYMRNVLNDYLY